MESVLAAGRVSRVNSTSIESLCFWDRSFGVTPIATRQPSSEIRILSELVSKMVKSSFLAVRLVQGFSTGEPGFDVVPEGDGVLTEVPAQIDNAAVSHVGKVAKAFVDILNHNAQIFYLMKQDHQMSHRFDVLDAVRTETI